MAYAKDKNIIKYTGRLYEITFNVADGSLTTNHPNGRQFIQQTASRSECELAKLIKLVAYSNTPINPYVETIMVAAPGLWSIISKADGWYMRAINELITLAQQNWKYVLQLEKSTDGNPYAVDGYVNYQTAIEAIKIASLGLNELETKWYKRYGNIPFVKKFAGQLEMYNPLLSGKCRDVIHWYNSNKIDITPYLTSKNLLQVLKELDTNKEQLRNKKIADGLMATYEKYKSLEGTSADGWSYQILNTYDQFKKEAKEMHNCLIRCEYHEKMADGRCVIVVATAPDGTRIDIELRPHATTDGMYVSQAYYDKDYSLSREHTLHLREWADGLRF